LHKKDTIHKKGTQVKLSLKKSWKKATTHLNRYAKGLLLTKGKKSCEEMGNLLCLSHDKIYRSMMFISCNISFVQELSLRIIKEHSKEFPGWLVIDDTAVTKVYSKFMQGVVWMYNVLVGKEQKQFNILVFAWTNGSITVPIDFLFWYPKHSCDQYKTKSELAIELLKKWWFKVPSKGLLGDGHFSTLALLNFCNQTRIPLVAKFSSNRKIASADGISTQVKHHPGLKLHRNQRSKTAKIIWHELTLFCTVHKRKNKNNEYNLVYYISTVRKASKEYVKLYGLRWEIEKMFRTMKQSLGLKDCFARKKALHVGHIFGVFHAYTFAQYIKSEENLSYVEKALRHLRDVKPEHLDNSLHRFNHNFGVIA